jgi:Fur family transcriptional regulator, peroxide stress response regulator
MALRKKMDKLENEPVGLTRQRKIVLQVIMESGQHPTAADIFDGAKKRLPTISFATVYNSLRYLKEAKLIREITFGNAASRYDSKNHRHDHAICTKCGKLLDFELKETVGLMRRAAQRTRFAPESIHLTLIGICPECHLSNPD